MAQAMQLATRGSQPLEQVVEESRNQFLTYSLGGEVMAIEIRFIKEILQFGGLTEVPLMPSAIRGVINLRGAVVPVIDLGVRLGRTSTTVDRRTCIVILDLEENGESVVMGILVDFVSEVREIADADIEPAPAFGSHLRPEFIRGVGKVQGKLVILLNMAPVLASEELGAPA